MTRYLMEADLNIEKENDFMDLLFMLAAMIVICVTIVKIVEKIEKK